MSCDRATTPQPSVGVYVPDSVFASMYHGPSYNALNVKLPLTITNTGESTITVSLCGNYSVETLVSHTWQTAWHQACVYVLTGPTEVPPGATVHDTVYAAGSLGQSGSGVWAGQISGRYRLRLRARTSNFADVDYYSNSFVLDTIPK